MAQFLKPSNLNNVWASGGDRIYPGDTKYATGWQVEIPPRQYFNEIDYKQDQMLAHLNQHGIPVWDSETEYQANQSYVQGSTGTVYRCVLTHTNQNPDLDVSNTYWIIAFASAGDFYTAAESDARYAQISSNGGDYNAAAFRTNISVYSKAETYTKTEVDSRTTVASTLQAQSGTSNSVLLTPLRLRDALNTTGTAPIFAARAWGNIFGGTGSSPAFLRGAGNVASVSRIGTGLLQVTFNVAMPDANYAIILTGVQTSTGAVNNADATFYYDRKSTGFKLECWNTETTLGDLSEISFIVMR